MVRRRQFTIAAELAGGGLTGMQGRLHRGGGANEREVRAVEPAYASSDGGITLVSGYRHKVTRALVGEWNLWGRLREVIVGDPEGTTVPHYERVLEQVGDPLLVDLIQQNGGKPLKEAAPDYYACLST